MTRKQVRRKEEERREGQEDIEGWWKGTAPLVAKLNTVSGLLNPNWFLL